MKGGGGGGGGSGFINGLMAVCLELVVRGRVCVHEKERGNVESDDSCTSIHDLYRKQKTFTVSITTLCSAQWKRSKSIMAHRSHFTCHLRPNIVFSIIPLCTIAEVLLHNTQQHHDPCFVFAMKPI